MTSHEENGERYPNKIRTENLTEEFEMYLTARVAYELKINFNQLFLFFPILCFDVASLTFLFSDIL